MVLFWTGKFKTAMQPKIKYTQHIDLNNKPQATFFTHTSIHMVLYCNLDIYTISGPSLTKRDL